MLCQMSADKLIEPLAKALDKHKPSTLTYDQHRRMGAQAGAHWKSATTIYNAVQMDNLKKLQ